MRRIQIRSALVPTALACALLAPAASHAGAAPATAPVPQETAETAAESAEEKEAAPEPADPTMAAGRELTRLFYQGELREVHERFSAEMKTQIPLEQLQGFLKQVGEQMGVEQEVLAETLEDRGDYRVYARRARFEKFPQEVVVLWAFRQDGEVGGFFIRPAEAPAGSPAAGG